MRHLIAATALLLATDHAHGIDLVGVRFADDLAGHGGSGVPPAPTPLSQTVVFTFDGIPQLGPTPGEALRVRTSQFNTFGQPIDEPAFGDYTVESNKVLFRTRLPTSPVPLTFSPDSDPGLDASLPGMRPGTLYEVTVSLDPSGITNLTGIAPLPLPFDFITVGSPPFFTNASPDVPKVVSVLPQNGTQGVGPNLFSDPAGLFGGIRVQKRPPFRVRFDVPLHPDGLADAFRVVVASGPGGGPSTASFAGHAVFAKNEYDGAEVLFYPEGVLPLGHTVQFGHRRDIASLSGNTGSAGSDFFPIATYTIADDPRPGRGIDDAILETFETTLHEDLTVIREGAILAGWDRNNSNALVAAQGFSGDGSLGRFKPLSIPTGPTTIIFDTDSQALPLANGATPDVPAGTVVMGGVFHFTDFTLPVDTILIAKGSNPLVITVTGEAIIEGVIDLDGEIGGKPPLFHMGFMPVPGGSAGAGGGRGGDAHPVVTDGVPLAWLQSPAFSESGYGPGNTPGGGGGGGQSGATMPWKSYTTPECTQFSGAGDGSRGSGGGGGSFANFFPNAPEPTGFQVSGRRGAIGSGNHLPIPVDFSQPIPAPPAAYEGGPNAIATPNLGPTFAEAYLGGMIYDKGGQMDVQSSAWANSIRITLYGQAGPPVFKDGEPNNDYIGLNGELAQIQGGQGGGAGGSRTTGLDISCQPYWNSQGLPLTTLDARGGSGGGAGGALLLQAIGPVRFQGPVARISARGGSGGGGEQSGSSIRAGAAGGGSGGCIVLQSSTGVFLNDPSLSETVIDVSGATGKDASNISGSHAVGIPGGDAGTLQYADGGPGGPGLVQIHTPDPSTIDTSRISAKVIKSVLDIRQNATTQIQPLVDMSRTPVPNTPLSVGRSTWYDLGAVGAPFRDPLSSVAGLLPTPIFGVPGLAPFFTGTNPATGAVLTDATGSVLHPDQNDFEIDAPDLGVDDFIPQGPTFFQTVHVLFQGADGDPDNVGCPALATATKWSSDIRDLNGKSFIRFSVVFNVSVAPAFPTGPGTPRPRMNFLRIPYRF